MLIIENRAAWHPSLTDETIRDVCALRDQFTNAARAAAAYIELGQPVPAEYREATIDILINGPPKVGFCLFCGTKWDGIEPDACNEECLDCGAPEVFGCAYLLDQIGKSEESK